MEIQIHMPPLKLLIGAEQHSSRQPLLGSRRGTFELIADVLLFCREEKRKTKIMHENNLNYAQLQSQLDLLTSRGLLEHENGKFVTTGKGLVSIELFLKIHRILQDTGF